MGAGSSKYRSELLAALRSSVNEPANDDLQVSNVKGIHWVRSAFFFVLFFATGFVPQNVTKLYVSILDEVEL